MPVRHSLWTTPPLLVARRRHAGEGLDSRDCSTCHSTEPGAITGANRCSTELTLRVDVTQAPI
jgi:hypothetical protein